MKSSPRLAVVTVADDLHALVLRKVLRDRHATDLAIIHSDRLAATGLVNWSADASRPAILPDCEGRPVDLAALEVLWWRRPSGKGWNPHSGFLSSVTDEAARDLIYNDCVAALNGIVQAEFRGTWVNPPEATRRAEMKFVQLRAAQAAGLAVPRTLISQNPAEIRAFCAGRRVIVKAIAGTVKTPLMAQDVTPALLANDAALRLSPAIWQERIDGNHSASPIVAEGRIYFLSEDGVGTVLKAGRTFEKLAVNKLGERTLASYAAAPGALYIRGEKNLFRINGPRASR